MLLYRYEVISNVYKPESTLQFPSHEDFGKLRRFSREWLKQHSPWLGYSKELDGGLCIPCVLFASRNRCGQDLGTLVVRPLKTFNKATEILRKHATLHYHKNAMADLQSFLARMKQQRPSVLELMQSAHTIQVQKNRAKLLSILQSIIWCGKQNIALRGHRDDDKTLDDSQNPGNFKSLLKFRVEAGDEILKEHFNTAPKNATYTSKTIQNELIEVVGDWIRKKIVKEIKEAQVYTILADEVADVSNTEQLSLVLRFVDGMGRIKEMFTGFIRCKEVTGAALATSILSTIESYGLNPQLIRGQGYDGAGNMASHIRGTASRIKAQVPLATYVHCFSHKLNLVIVGACQVQSIRNAMGIISKVAFFFENSPKRQETLESKIKATEQPNRRQKLLDLCKTRWIQRHEALEIFYQLFEVVVEVLQDMKISQSHWNRDTVADADAFLTAITKFEFLLALVVTWKGLSLVKGLRISLQSSSLDICKAYKSVTCTVRAVQMVRDEVDKYSHQWLDLAVEKSDAVGAEGPCIPRRCGRQRNRSNVPAETAEEYFKRTVIIPFLDHLLTQLSDRFSSDENQVVLGLSLVPTVMASDQKWQEKALELSKHYEVDLPSPHDIDMELVCWKTKWDTDSQGIVLPNSPQDALAHADVTYFPNINMLLRIVCTLPVTSCSCERSFSGLRRLKTYLRSTMTQERLNGLALMNFHYSMDIDLEDVLNTFARMHPRRMALTNILDFD